MSRAQAPQFVMAWDGYGTGPSQSRTPVGVAVDAPGNLYVVDTHDYHVKKISSDGGASPNEERLGTRPGNSTVRAPSQSARTVTSALATPPP